MQCFFILLAWRKNFVSCRISKLRVLQFFPPRPSIPNLLRLIWYVFHSNSRYYKCRTNWWHIKNSSNWLFTSMIAYRNDNRNNFCTVQLIWLKFRVEISINHLTFTSLMKFYNFYTRGYFVKKWFEETRVPRNFSRKCIVRASQ